MVHLISMCHQNTLYNNTLWLHVIYNSPKKSHPVLVHKLQSHVKHKMLFLVEEDAMLY